MDTIDLRNLATDCGSKPSPHKGGHARRFIVPDDGGRDVFVHASVVRDAGLVELVPDQAVTFAVTQGPKGPQVASISG